MSDYTRSFDIGTEGRTLVGIAFRWDHPSVVRDPGTAAYLEEFARACADKTISERPVFPLLKRHDLSIDPIGVSRFRAGTEGLMFEAPLSKTPDADATLELINDGAMRSVSVRFAALKSGRRSSLDGPVTVRQEIKLRELSVCPTGFGQHDGAEVLAVRSELRMSAAQRRLLLLDLAQILD